GAPPTSGGAEKGIDGTWTVASAGETFVGNRVKEELAQVGATTAVGRTSDVRGTVTIVGGAVQPGSSFMANLQTLKSDRSQRDNALRRQALETDVFPNAAFT
ncbi:MAG: YceI family protein, partial [Chloroflexota bacterium]